MAQAVPVEWLSRLINYLNETTIFNWPPVWPKMARIIKHWAATGGNGMWPPINNYMVLRGLTQKGYDDLAYDIACSHSDGVIQVFKDADTVWEFCVLEANAPGEHHDGKRARSDMVG